MSKKNQEQPQIAEAQVVEELGAPEQEQKQLDPREFSYRQEDIVEVPAEVFEMLRGYVADLVQKYPPKKMFSNLKPVITKKKEGKKTVQVIEYVEYESDEEYKEQTAVEFRDTDSFNAVYVANQLLQTHIQNIEKGIASPVEVLRKEQQAKQEGKLKKVEE